MLVLPHHINNVFSHQRSDDPCPAVLCEPLLLEHQGALALLFCLINQREEVEGLVQDRWPRKFLVRRVVKGVDKLRVIVNPVADHLPTGLDNRCRRMLLGPRVDHHKQVDPVKVGLHNYPVPGQSLGVAGSQNSQQYFGRVPIEVFLNYER